MRAAVLTALMDDYDTLKPVCPQEGAEVDWICLTDSVERLAEAQAYTLATTGNLIGDHDPVPHPSGWTIMYYNRAADEHPNRAAKRPKVAPAMFTDAPASVWIDASFRVVSPRFVVDTLTIAREAPSGIAQFVHPWRSDLFDEVNESRCLPKYAGERAVLDWQAQVYADAGMPRNWGLWATGVIAREHRNDVLAWGHVWDSQIRAHSYQDQVSHPYVSWLTGLRPASLPGTHFVNAWLAYEGSARHG